MTNNADDNHIVGWQPGDPGPPPFTATDVDGPTAEHVGHMTGFAAQRARSRGLLPTRGSDGATTVDQEEPGK